MLITHRGHTPQVHPSAWIAPNAVLAGDVTVGPGARIMYGAVLTAEDGEVSVGADCVVLEHAVLRGRAGAPCRVGDAVLVGPHAHLNGTTVGDECFLATGAALFPQSVLGAGCEVRIHAVVQVRTVLPPGTTVPIGWVAVGDPPRILPPGRHEEIWAVQEPLDFPRTVYGVDRSTSMRELLARQSAWYGAHRADAILPEAPREDGGGHAS